jgi:hypothetical protein
MNKILQLLIILSIFIGGCAPKKPVIRISPISDVDPTMPAGMIYALPQTVLKIEIEMLEVKTCRGPYYRFAEKYLGITGVAREDETEWLLKKLNIEMMLEADPEWYFVVYRDDGKPCCPDLFNLSAEGLLMDVNKLVRQPDNIEEDIYPLHAQGLLYTDLSIWENKVINTDTLYKTILTDTTFIRIPVLREQSVAKTIDEKAEEAASFIFDMRERRADLITGEYDFYPEETALKTGLEKIDEIENEYLSLFIGKKIEIPHKLIFYYVPVSGEIYENIELFEYSEQGISDDVSGRGNLVSLLIKNTNKTEILTEYSQKFSNPDMNIIYYRIPDMAEVEILDQGKSILKARMPISQYGAIVRIPIE